MADMFPNITEHIANNRTDLMQKEGALPALFTPSETAPWQLPQITADLPDLPALGLNNPQLLAGLYNPTAGAINSAIASPGGMLTLPLSGPLSLVPKVGRLVGGAFAVDQARQVAENAPGTLRTILDPNATTQQKVEAGTGLATTAAMGGLGALHALDARLAGKTPEQQSKAIREEIKVTEDKAIADKLTDAADQIDREIAARDEAEASAKEQQQFLEKQQKAAEQAQKAQQDAVAAAQEVPKSTQILQESAKPPVLANIATEAGTQTSPFALQGKLNEITAIPEPAPAQIAAPSQAEINFNRRKALFDAKKAAEKEAVPELPQISREPAGPNPPGDVSPRQRAARMRQESAGVKGVSFKAPMATETVAPFEAETVVPAVKPEMTAAEAKAAELKSAVAVPGVDYQYTVFRMEEGGPPVIQIDVISPEGRSLGSTSLKELKAAGVKLPEVPDSLPQGQYMADEVRAASKLPKGETERAIPEQGSNQSVLRGETPQPEIYVGLQKVGSRDAELKAPSGDIARSEAQGQSQVSAEPVANEKIDALNESKLVALADQLGIKTMGMSGERLRSRIISNALPEDIVMAIDNPVAPRAKIKGSKADKWADSVIKQGRQLSGFDPELLAAHTIKLVGQLESGAVKFVDWSAEKIKEAGEAIRPYLQQIWDAAHAQVAAKPEAMPQPVQSGGIESRGRSNSSLLDYDTVAKSTDAAKAKYADDFIAWHEKNGTPDTAISEMRKITDAPFKAVVAARLLAKEFERSGTANVAERSMVNDRIDRLLGDIALDKMQAGQALQAQAPVNKVLEPYAGELALRGALKRQRDEVVKGLPRDSAVQINNGLKVAGEKAAEQIATDAPGVSSVLKGAISRVKRSVDIDWRKVFTGLPEVQEAQKAEIFKRISEDPKVAGLPEAARKKLAETMEEAWRSLRDKEFRKEFDKVISLPGISKTDKIATTRALPELIDKANLGLLDNEAFAQAIGRQYGIKDLDPAVSRKLRDLGQKAARTPEGSERNEVYQQIMDTIMEARGVNPWDFLKDFWYRNVMSAPRTAIEIGAGGVIQGAARTLTTAVDTAIRQKEPGLALRMIGMFLKDATTGARLGADLVKTGDRAILPRYTEQFLAKMANLEKGKSPGGEIESLYRRSSGATKAALAPFEMTGRLLTALDYIGGQGVRSQQMLYSALTHGDKVSFEAAMRRFNGEEVAKASDRARTELGDKARPAQIIARQREILNEGIDKSIQDFGNTMTEVTALNAPPAGISGGIYKAVSQLPMMVRAPAGLAFAKAGLNIFQELTNWAPVTGQINWARTLWQNPGKNNPFRFLALDKLPPERARQLVVAQATGLAVLTAAASKFLGSQPGDDQNKPREWEISGPWTGLTPTQKSALMSSGERPLSIKLPNGRWVDYKLTPFMSSLATIGHIRDQERFNGKKYTGEDAANKAVNAWLMGLGSVKDLSLASSFSRLAGFLATDDRELNVDGVTRTLADSVGNAAVGLIPMSSMLRELDNTTDSQRYRSDKKNPGVDLWLTQVPFVRRFVNDGKPLLNFLGEPVRVNVNPVNRHVGPGPSTAPVEAVLSDKVGLGMKLPTLSDNTTIVDKAGKQRPMTGDEIYDYQKSVRQAYARQIAADLPLFQKATPEQASLYSQQVFTAAERYARDRLNTGAQWNGVIPVDPKLTSALSPEYQAVKQMDSDEGSKSALNASRMRVNYDEMINAPDRGAAFREIATKQPVDQTVALIKHATSTATDRTALQRATAGLTAPTRAEFFISELAKRTTPEEKRTYLQQQLAAGLINKEVLRQMAIQGQKN